MDPSARKKNNPQKIYMDSHPYGPKRMKKKQSKKSKKIQNANHSCVDIKYYFKKIKSGVYTN